MPIKADFAIVNANELVTLRGSSGKPKVKDEMNCLDIIRDGAVAVKDGKIVAVGPTKEVQNQLEKRVETVDADGKLVTPGLIDPHVHLIFAGSR